MTPSDPLSPTLLPMPIVHLVRHGEVRNPNHVCYADLPGFNLSPLGVLQAHAAGRHLSASGLDHVITSPLARAVQTATAIARPHGHTPEPDRGLIESGQYPGWTGVRWDDIRTHFPAQIDAYLTDATTMPDVQETIEDIAVRVAGAIHRTLAGGHGVLAVVAHQDPIQAARLWMTGRSLTTLLDDPPSHASVTTLTGSQHEGWVETASWVPEP